MLSKLYDAVPKKYQSQLESTFQASHSVVPSGYELVAFINTASPTLAPGSGPPDRDISSLKGFFEYFDEDVILWQKRYSWELIEEGRWRHYVSDISVFVELINPGDGRRQKMVTRWAELKTDGSSSFRGGRLAACKPFRVFPTTWYGIRQDPW